MRNNFSEQVHHRDTIYQLIMEVDIVSRGDSSNWIGLGPPLPMRSRIGFLRAEEKLFDVSDSMSSKYIGAS